MNDIILEVIRSIVLAGIIIYLLKVGRSRSELSNNGWQLIIAGFFLLFLGSTIDITDNFESLNKFIVIGDTPTQAFLEKLIGYLGGFIVLAIGLVRWIPTITAVEELKKFQIAADGVSEHVMFTDANGVIIYANKAAEKMTGYSIKEMIGKRPSLWGNQMGKEFYAKMWKIIKEDKKSFSGELKNTRKNGEKYIVELQISPILDKNNCVEFFIGIERDITERKKIEEMKSDFVSLISHQLKTPVAEIRGYVDIMLSGLAGELTKKQKEYLQDMSDISFRNYKLISDILNVSQLDRGIITTDIKPVKLAEIIDFVLKEYDKSAKGKGIALQFEKPSKKIIVLADKDKLIEAISNIVHNAIKFTEKGSIIIKTTTDKDFGIVEISDTGRGMSQETLSHLFKKERVLTGSPVAGSGAGIGLYIAKSFMELQNGDVTASSVLGKGSTFIFKIPLAKV